MIENRAANSAVQDKDMMERLKIDATQINCKAILGQGSFGEVYKSEYRGRDVAVKTMTLVNDENLERFENESLLMADLKHENIVALIGCCCCWERDLMALVMELCDKGMSNEVLELEGSEFTWNDPMLRWSMVDGLVESNGTPKTMIDLVTVCWAEDQTQRSTF